MGTTNIQGNIEDKTLVICQYRTPGLIGAMNYDLKDGSERSKPAP
jgi:hypothetical protein